MSGDPLDDGGTARHRTRTDPARRRRGLRVPIADVRPISVHDDLADDAESVEPNVPSHGPTNNGRAESFPPSEPPSGVMRAIGERGSMPPEELSLDEADVSFIPIPKPPPPPVGYVPPPVQEQEVLLSPWFEDFFGSHYLATVRTPTPREVATECDFIERALGLAPGARILDVGCGIGLQTVELAARGYQVVGFDISDVMLSRAKAEAEDRGLQIRFVQGDMREIPFEASFDGVLCWGTSFGYFGEDDNERALRAFRKALRPKGVLLLDVVNRDFMIGSQPNQVWFEVDGSVCMEETDFDYRTSRLSVKRRVAAQGSGNETDREYSIRLFALHELCHDLKNNGFRVDQVSGRDKTLGVFFGVDSPKMIIRAERTIGNTGPGAAGPDGAADDAAPPPPVPDAIRRSSFRAPTTESADDTGNDGEQDAS